MVNRDWTNIDEADWADFLVLSYGIRGAGKRDSTSVSGRIEVAIIRTGEVIMLMLQQS